jgi:hypothetical protein
MGKTRRKEQQGGSQLDIRQILVTKPIMNAARNAYNNNNNNNNKEFFNSSIAPKYYTQQGQQGFHLTRMKRMKEANLNSLLNSEPIEVRKIHGKGVKINGALKQAYEIINGRHRLARAISLNKETVKVKIIE